MSSSLLRMPLQTNTGHPLTTEYHREPINPSDAPPLLVFVPGNPGLIDYYITYLDLIAEEYTDFEILAISHAGYQTSDDYVTAGNTGDQRFYDLEYQVGHKCDVIKQHLAGKPKTELYFLCHSVGAHVIQRVVKRILDDDDIKNRISVKFVGLVCPTIVDIAKSESGVMFTRLFNALPVIQIAVCLIVFLQWILPKLAAMAIIRFITAKPAAMTERLAESWNNSVIATHKIYSSKRIVRQALTLAREELNVIHRDDEFNDWFFNTLPTEGVKIWCFFAISDYWVHDNTRDYILGRYHDSENKMVRFEIGEPDNEKCNAICHSFCIDQSVEFAAITCHALA